MICDHHIDTIVPARESMYGVPPGKWKLDLIADAFKSIPRGREGDHTSLDMQNHIDVRRHSLYCEARVGDVQLNHEPAN